MTYVDKAFALTRALQWRIVPELRYSQTFYEEHSRRYASGVESWLDVGCGHHLLPPWRLIKFRQTICELRNPTY